MGTSAKRREDDAIWALFLAIAVALVWSFFQLGGVIKQVAPELRGMNASADATAGAIGAVIGIIGAASFIVAVVVWVIVYFAFVSSRAPRRGPIYFFILWAVVAAADTGAIFLIKAGADKQEAQEKAQFKVAAGEIGATFGKIASGSSAPGAFDTRVKAQGDAGQLERLTKQFTGSIVADRQSYLAEARETGFPAFLRPQSLSSPGAVRRAQERIGDLHAIVGKYHARYDADLAGFRASVQAAQMSDQLKAGMLAGFDKSSADNRGGADRVWELEDSIFSEYGQALSVLSAGQGRWAVIGGKIEFRDPTDLQAFNAHVHRAQALAAEQQVLQSKARAGVGRVSEDLERAAH